MCSSLYTASLYIIGGGLLDKPHHLFYFVCIYKQHSVLSAAVDHFLALSLHAFVSESLLLIIFITLGIQYSACWPFYKSLAVKHFFGVVKLSKILCCSLTIPLFWQTDQISILLYLDFDFDSI